MSSTQVYRTSTGTSQLICLTTELASHRMTYGAVLTGVGTTADGALLYARRASACLTAFRAAATFTLDCPTLVSQFAASTIETLYAVSEPQARPLGLTYAALCMPATPVRLADWPTGVRTSTPRLSFQRKAEAWNVCLIVHIEAGVRQEA